MTDTWPQPFPPAWADEWGEDTYGLYAWFSLNETVRQCCRWIPPGHFMMGSPDDELWRDEDEQQHSVTLSQGYWLADTACTQALWEVVMGDNPAEFKDDPENPVEQVSWDDVQLFLEKLNQSVPGLQAGLPTEAQWEYACRAGTDTPFSFGDTLTTDQANYNGKYPYVDGEKGEYRQKTIPVKALPHNMWGLYQMHGNVREWCQDRWQKNYDTQPMVGLTGPLAGERRLVRGGSLLYEARYLRSAFCFRILPGSRGFDLGFRFASGQVV